MKYQEIEGDLIELAKQGMFDVITHGCNCFCLMGAGIALPMAMNFGCDEFPMEGNMFKGKINKLGVVNHSTLYQEKSEYGGKWVKYPDEPEFTTGKKLVVINSYTQYQPGSNLSYSALMLCMQKINHMFSRKHIGLPMIGCGIAGGNWKKVQKILKEELKDMKVTIVKFKKNEI